MTAPALRQKWEALAPREQLLLVAAAAVVLVALLWWVLLGPAIHTLRVSDAQHAHMDAQLQQVLRLQAQAQSMQSQPRQNHDEALRLLETGIRQQLGTAARYAISGERVSVTLAGVSSEVLAQWLTQARVNARALPTEARLQRNAAGQWEGSLVLSLPPR
jgi:general secretion pathway protein M